MQLLSLAGSLAVYVSGDYTQTYKYIQIPTGLHMC